MKKRLTYFKSDKVFYLPYVLFVSVIALSFITTFIIVYNNELNISNQLMEQAEAEILIQIWRAKLIDETAYVGESLGEVKYVFSSGEIKIKYEVAETGIYMLHYYEVTSKGFDFQIIGYLDADD